MTTHHSWEEMKEKRKKITTLRTIAESKRIECKRTAVIFNIFFYKYIDRSF